MTFPIRLRLPALALLGAGALALTSAPSQAYSALYVFGDSLSDVGNAYALTSGAIPASPYAGGRFSNGPVWAETLSAKLNLGPLVPALLKGNDYAFGYATASDAVPGSNPAIPDVQQQVKAYALAHGSKAAASALYTVWIGSNDVLNALAALGSGTLSFNDALADLAKSAQAEVDALKTLVQDGARHLLVGLVPDIGLTPRLNATPLASTATLFADTYNQQVKAAAKGEASLMGDIGYFDTFTLLEDAVKDPSAYGFKDVTSACYTGPFTGGGSSCADPETSLFWDSVHPTTAGHDLIADLALRSLPNVSPVPLPASAPMFGAALALLGIFAAVRRRTARQAS